MERKKVRCKLCNSYKEGISLNHYNLKICLKCFPVFFKKRINNTIEKFKMFDYATPLLVALSGGKDSMSLTKALHELGYNIKALHINIEIDEISKTTEETVKNFCIQENIPLKIINLKKFFDAPLYNLAKLAKKPICAVCGMIRRYILNKEAKDEIIITGHTLNDEVSFILKNLIFWHKDLLSRISPTLIEKEGLKRKAKPLCLTTEEETKIFCEILGIKYVNEPCPYKSETYDFFKNITDKINKSFPGSLIGFYKGFLKRIKNFSENNNEKISLLRCIKCGYPTVSELCSICRLREKLLEYRDG